MFDKVSGSTAQEKPKPSFIFSNGVKYKLPPELPVEGARSKSVSPTPSSEPIPIIKPVERRITR